MKQWIENLERKLAEPLPGSDAQYKMAHAVRRRDDTVPSHARVACTMALMYPKQQAWHMVLIQRVGHPKDQHSGQISFPGGKMEPSDVSLAAAALRETEEEIGIDRKKIQLLGNLTPLYIPVSGFLVHPFVGFIDFTPTFVPQPREVAQVLEVPIEVFKDEALVQKTDLRIDQHITLKDVPYYAIQNQVVWGATAMMLSELTEIIE